VNEFEEPAVTVEAVVHRAYCLGAMIARCHLESYWSADDAEQCLKWGRINDRVVTWVEDERLAASLSPTERRLLNTSVGSWSSAELLDMSWRMESLGILGWALAVFEKIPPYDTQFDPVFEPFSPLGEAPGTLCARVRVRPPEQLAQAEEEAEKWHWRATQVRGYFAQPGARPARPVPRRAELIRSALGDDVKLFGKRYEALSAEQFSLANSIARERHYALEWIWNGEPWDEVTTDT
jgi:hypothetical protein